MYEIGYIFHDDEEYSKIAEYCTKHNYLIKEIGCDEKGRSFEIAFFDTAMENKKAEVAELRFWFDTFYAQHEQKYRRFIALNKNTDEGENPSEKLMSLYEEAEKKRARINELEKEIGE